MTTRPDQEITASLLSEAVALVGSQTALGKATGRSQNAVWHALKTGRVTAEFALDIHRATQGQVSRSRLRPDIFGEAV